MPGLAHFLEHALFLGNSRFPGESAWGKYVAAAGGSSNAYTSQALTNYFFSVDAPQARATALRFGAFFSSPLLDAEALTREVLAVDSEHAKNLRSDAWREWQLLKSTAKPGSPLAAFSTGNRDTLRGGANGTRAALGAFFAAHYAAPHMAAALSGPQSLPELEEIARAAFGGVRDAPSTAAKEARASGAVLATEDPQELAAADAAVSAAAARAAALATPDAAFPFPSAAQSNAQHTSSRGLLFALSPEAPTHTLSLIWPIVRTLGSGAERSDATKWLAAVLSDSRAGGLQSSLRDADLAESVEAGLDLDSSPLGLFSLRVVLAPAATARVADIASRVGKQAGREVLAAIVGAIVDATARALDVAEDAIRVSALAASVAGGEGRGGLRDDEVAVLSAPPMRRADWENDRDQAILLSAAEREIHRTLQDSAAAKESVDSDGGASAIDVARGFWTDARDAALGDWLYPGESAASDIVSELASRLAARKIGADDLLAPPMRQIWRARDVLRLLRQLVPSASIALLSSQLVAAVGESHRDALVTTAGNCAGIPSVEAATASFASASERARAPATDATKFARDYCEPIYGTRYAISPLAAFVRAAGASGGGISPHAATASLPPRNSFIAHTFTLAEHGAKECGILGLRNAGKDCGAGPSSSLVRYVEPMLLVPRSSMPGLAAWKLLRGTEDVGNAPPAAIWWAPETSGLTPRVKVGIDVVLPCSDAQGSPRSAVLTAVSIYAVNDALGETLAALRTAGGDFSLSQSGSMGGCGFQITLRTFSGAPLTAAVEELLSKGLNSDMKGGKVRFTAALTSFAERAAAALLDAPISRAFSAINELTGALPWSRESLLAAAWDLSGVTGRPLPPLDVKLDAFIVQNATFLAEQIRTHWSSLHARALGTTVLIAGAVNASDALVIGESAIRALWAAIIEGRRGRGAAGDWDNGPSGALFDAQAAAAAAAAMTAMVGGAANGGGGSDAHFSQSAISAAAVLAARTHAAGTRPLPPLEGGVDLSLNSSRAVEEANAAAILFFDGGLARACDVCARRAAALDLIGEALAEPAFDELRTRRALGYVAGAAARSLRGRSAQQSTDYARIATAELDWSGAFLALGSAAALRAGDKRSSLYCYVQGPFAPAQTLIEAIDDFMSSRGAAQAIVLDKDKAGPLLDSIGSALAAKLREQSIDATADAFNFAWQALAGAPNLMFDERFSLADAYEAVSADDAREAWERVVGVGHGRVAVLVNSGKVGA
jgi:secreted Zn-dependent insulinase-like peptidase